MRNFIANMDTAIFTFFNWYSKVTSGISEGTYITLGLSTIIFATSKSHFSISESNDQYQSRKIMDNMTKYNMVVIMYCCECTAIDRLTIK